MAGVHEAFKQEKAVRKVCGLHVLRIFQSMIFISGDIWWAKFANEILTFLGEMRKNIRSTTETIEVTVLRKV
jgi:hypothetical protein